MAAYTISKPLRLPALCVLCKDPKARIPATVTCGVSAQVFTCQSEFRDNGLSIEAIYDASAHGRNRQWISASSALRHEHSATLSARPR